MAYSIVLNHNLLGVSPEGTYRIQVWVHEYTPETDPSVFVYQRYPLVPADITLRDQFVNVASVADLVEYPTNTPTDKSPFFRKTNLDLEFKSVDKLRIFWIKLQDDVCSLINNLNRLADPAEATTRTVTV